MNTTNTKSSNYDVIVIGGGPAGLSGALILGRARRTVLVVDAGNHRNAPASHAHGFLTRDGVPPAEILTGGREEVRRYGGEIAEGTVVAAERLADTGFRVVLDDGRSATASRLLVATGLTDELPDVVGLAQRWGHDVLHCPYCHGWEVRDRSIGVIANGPLAVHQALLWRQWSERVRLFLHTTDEPSDDEYEKLAARGIEVVLGAVDAVETADGRLTGLRLADGHVLECDALAVGTRMVGRTAGLEGLGLEPTEQVLNGHPVGTYIAADPTGATSVPGVWVAGNVTDLSGQIVGAAAAGTRAGAMINMDLITTEAERAVAARAAAAQPA